METLQKWEQCLKKLASGWATPGPIIGAKPSSPHQSDPFTSFSFHCLSQSLPGGHRAKSEETRVGVLALALMCFTVSTISFPPQGSVSHHSACCVNCHVSGLSWVLGTRGDSVQELPRAAHI